MPILRIVLMLVTIGAAGVASTASAAGGGPTAIDSADPAPARQRELLELLKQDCGSCHGMRLTGGLGPALTPEALRTKPVDSLVATIFHGRSGTPMPPWRRFVSEAEAQWLVARMLAGTTDAGSP